MCSLSKHGLSKCGEEGGYLAAVCDLIRWLRAAACWDYSHALENQVQSLSPTTPPQVVAKALQILIPSLAHVLNEPPSRLSAEQHRELRTLCQKAIRHVNYEKRRIQVALARRGRAISSVSTKLKQFAKFQELSTFAIESLKGFQRKIVENVCGNAGSCPLPDLAVTMGWNREEAGPKFNDAMKEINPKLKAAGLPWRLRRRSNCAEAHRIPEK
jgi:hypothetical protein